jgi:hypothetical protein
MKTISISIFLCFISLGNIFSQNQDIDSLFTTDEILLVNVKQVTIDGVMFTYPKEDILNTISKNVILKIKFKSGRVQSFSESNFNLITGSEDWQKVAISQVESEIIGLHKLDEVRSKAKGTTEFSTVSNVQNRAYDKLKMQAALLGANVVFLVNQATLGGKSASFINSTETNLVGIAYSNRKMKKEPFLKIIGTKKDFELTKTVQITKNDTEILDFYPNSKILRIENVREEKGNLFVTNAKGFQFRVSYFDENKIVLVFRDSDVIQNYVLAVK